HPEPFTSVSLEEIKEFHANVITRALGVSEKVEVDVASVELRSGDTLLVCTDGAWRVLPDRALAEALSSGHEPEKIGRSLVRMSVEAKASDNVAVAVARFSGEGLSASEDMSVAAMRCPERRGATPDKIKNSVRPRHRRDEAIRRPSSDTGAIAIFDAAEL